MNIEDRSGSSSGTTVCAGSYISGVGHNLPERVVDNHYFASYLETNDEWIKERTGIKERRWVEPGTSASMLALPACERAIASSGLRPEQIEGIIVATVTPDCVFPSTACILQSRLETRGLAVDMNAACAGFLYALGTADALITAGRAKHILVVGVDVYSSTLLDIQDRGTCILFGDGAGAVVLSSTVDLLEQEENRSTEFQRVGPFLVSGSKEKLRGIYALNLGADGRHGSILKVELGSAFLPTPEYLAERKHFLFMEGREVYKLAVRTLTDINKGVLEQAGLTTKDLNAMATHQANMRIIQSVAKQLGLPPEKVLTNVERVGNTSAASVPILLSEAVQEGKISRGDLVALSAFGGGLTWGAALVRW